jgi:putative DNA primase/helicase
MQRNVPLRDRARGKWHGILLALGIPAHLLDTRKHQPCPFCGGKDRYRFTDKDGDGRYICNPNGNGCGAGDGIDFVMKFKGWDFGRAAKEIEVVMGEVQFKSAKAKGVDPKAGTAMQQQLWDRCELVVPGDFVDRHFASRGVGQSTYPRCLRKCESVRHETEEGVTSWHPAMVAKILAPDGAPTNLHRTYLTLDGEKAAVEPVRKVMPGTIVKGSAIRLFDPGPVLGVAEGIETALAASELFSVPVWAATNSTLLAGWIPPEETHQVIVFGDNDPKFGGLVAASTLAHRLACQGLTVTIKIPQRVGDDWNDVLLEKRKVEG